MLHSATAAYFDAPCMLALDPMHKKLFWVQVNVCCNTGWIVILSTEVIVVVCSGPTIISTEHTPLKSSQNCNVLAVCA